MFNFKLGFLSSCLFNFNDLTVKDAIVKVQLHFYFDFWAHYTMDLQDDTCCSLLYLVIALLNQIKGQFSSAFSVASQLSLESS